MLMTIVQDAATGAAASPAAADTPLGLGALLVLFVGGSLAVLAWASRVRPMNLALGFATTVAMWTFAYVALLQPGRFAGEALFAGSVACVLAGGFVAGGWGLRRRPDGWNAQGAIALVAGGWLLSLTCLFTSPLWNWELGNAAPIAPALGLASAGPGASKVWLLERDSASQRPSLHWYLDSPASPLTTESSRWPGNRFRVLATVPPEDSATGGRCRMAQAGRGGWKSWDCRARRGAS